MTPRVPNGILFRMLETGSSYSNPRRLLIAVFVVFSGLVSLPFAAQAKITVETAQWHVDNATLQKGYSFQTADREIVLGMPSGSVDGGENAEAWVRLKQVKKIRVNIPKPKKLLSRIYRYDVYNLDGESTINSGLWLSVKWDTDTDKDYVLKQWNAETEKWEKIENTTAHTDTHTISATVTDPSAIVAVFSAEKKDPEYSGVASWMYFEAGAAMNVVPIGTRIEVENPETGAKATTTVVSTGPFTGGRLIDLPESIFDAIGNTSTGVMNVIVRVLN